MGLQLELSQEITDIIAKAITSHSGLEELCKMFIEHIRTIPEVQQILLYRETESVHLLTIIDAIPFERSIRNHIYEAEQIVLQQISSPIVEFHLINSRELEDDLSSVIPSGSETIFLKNSNYAKRA